MSESDKRDEEIAKVDESESATESIDLETDADERGQSKTAQEEMLEALQQRFGQQRGRLPGKGLIIATAAVFIIGIAGIIVAIALQVDWWIRLLIGALSVGLIAVYNFIFKRVQNGKRRALLSYAYDFGKEVMDDVLSGVAGEFFNREIGEFAEDDFFGEPVRTKTGSLYFSGNLTNGRQLSITFGELSAEVEIEGESTYDTVNLGYADNAALSGMDRDGYARLGKNELFGDIAEIVREYKDRDQAPEEEY